MNIKCEVEDGGAVQLSKDVAVSYNVHPNLFYAWVTMPDGHIVSLFVNRESGLVVTDYSHKNGRGGHEILRHTVNPKSIAFCTKLPKLEGEE